MSLPPSPRLIPLRLLIAALVPLLLSACGDLPEPFLGNPGALARRLAVPPIPDLAVPPPSHALLSAQGQTDFADLLALSLQQQDVPSLARAPHKTDWQLAVSAVRNGGLVVPHYAILDPSGHEQGAIDGASVPADSWIAGAPWTLGQAAQDAVPKVLALMMSIRATRDRANPNSLLNRAARLYVPEVTGAPGDGDLALTRLIRARLAEFGPLIQPTPDGADFTVSGHVTVSPLPKGKQQVEIAWSVTRPSGALVGKVSQLNSVAAGALDQYWGDVATVVTQEASGGIDTVVERFIGRPEGSGLGQGTAQGKGVIPAAGTSPGAASARTGQPVGAGSGGTGTIPVSGSGAGKSSSPHDGAAPPDKAAAGRKPEDGKVKASHKGAPPPRTKPPASGTMSGKSAAGAAN